MRLLSRRLSAELYSALPMKVVIARVERYVGAAGPLTGVPDTELLDGRVTEQSFRLRYGCRYGRVLVGGHLRERGGRTFILLRFREETVRIGRAVLWAMLVVALWYRFSVSVDWFSVLAPVLMGILGAAVIPRWGTSVGFADAVATELSEILDAVRL
jgi:hypothetical protein